MPNEINLFEEQFDYNFFVEPYHYELFRMGFGVESLRKEWIALSFDWNSKLVDGIVPAILLSILWVLIALTVDPIEHSLGQPGMLVFILGVLAVAMFALQHSLQGRFAAHLRALYGMIGGFLSWSVSLLSLRLGAPILSSPGGMILMIMAVLVISILWRNSLPIGAKFFCTAFFILWGEQVFADTLLAWVRMSPVIAWVYHEMVYVGALVSLGAVAYILFYSHRRIERIAAALILWAGVSLMILIARGGIY